MKLSSDNRKIYHDEDIFSIIENLQKEYRTVYWFHVDNDIYIYKPLGRRDFKEIVSNEELTEFDKQDEIIKRTLLYPNIKTFDLDETPAGLNEVLYETIMKNSFLPEPEKSQAILNNYRNEMWDLQNQIPCIINEAFPEYEIEDIENWDIERTAKFLSRAEWKLQNLRGLNMNYELAEQYEQAMQQQLETSQAKNTETATKSAKNIENKKALDRPTLEEMKRKFPEIDWDHDSVMMEGEAALQESVDVTPVALRVPR